jgi:hypothetical protein
VRPPAVLKPLHGTLLLGTLLLGGCVTSSLREVRDLEPLYTRRGFSASPESTGRCVQDYLEDRFGGRLGRMSGVVYERRQDPEATLLIGRDWASPSAVAFVLSLAPAGTQEVEAQLRMVTYRWPGTKTAVIESIEACVRPAS